MEVVFFWQGQRIGASIVSPPALDIGAVVVVKVPHPSPGEMLVRSAFLARAADGREFTIDVMKTKPDTGATADSPTSTLTGYLRSKES